jgi:hypothetical protein
MRSPGQAQELPGAVSLAKSVESVTSFLESNVAAQAGEFLVPTA